MKKYTKSTNESVEAEVKEIFDECDELRCKFSEDLFTEKPTGF